MSSVRKYSTFWPRFFAAIIDAIFLSILSGLLGSLTDVLPESVITVFKYVSIFEIYIYSVLLHGLYGQTIGKALLSLKVVNYPDEEDINFKQALLRDIVPVSLIATTLFIWFIVPIEENGNIQAVVYYLLVFTSVLHIIWYFLKFITMLSNKKRRGLHDFIARTIVIRLPELW